jgi:hypothetical protein
MVEKKTIRENKPKKSLGLNYNNNNNQTFYSQASWGRLEMKPYEKKHRYKTKTKNKGKTKGDKKTK